jgi:putative two-component system response regulator
MNILLLDDEPIAIALLKSHVSKLGDCTPVAFTRPAESLVWCMANEPDMVIVDYVMPQMDGIEFTRRFRRLPGKAEIPVLMVTADNDRELRHRALEMGINDFLTKPVDAVELTARMRNMLALRASQKHLAHRAQLLADEAAKSAASALEVATRERETLLCLGLAAERRDPETHEHITRMSHYSQLIGRRMGLTAQDAELLLLASPLHDVGKLGTPDHILLKRGKLTDDEFLIMKQHTVIGAEILSQSKSPILQAGAQIAISHHEKFDGSGYPAGLRGDAIPHFGRIVAVADVFDALTSARPYKKAWELDRALDFMREKSGSHFDPDCTDAFFDVLDDVLDIRAQHQDADMGAALVPPSPAFALPVLSAAF